MITLHNPDTESWDEDTHLAMAERYSNDTFGFRVLPSGRIAVFDRGFNMIALVDSFSEIGDLTLTPPADIIEPATQPVRPALAHLVGKIKL